MGNLFSYNRQYPGSNSNNTQTINEEQLREYKKKFEEEEKNKIKAKRNIYCNNCLKFTKSYYFCTVCNLNFDFEIFYKYFSCSKCGNNNIIFCQQCNKKREYINKQDLLSNNNDIESKPSAPLLNQQSIENEEELCIVCMERRKAIINYPCNHITSCIKCSVDWSNECIMCRSKIEKQFNINI